MMMPRLRLLKELLRPDGLIFISIDYNEVANLKLLMDEIFGESNYRNTFVVSRVKKNIQEADSVKRINWGHNYLLFYANSDSATIIPPVKKQKKSERWHSFDAPGIRPTMEYELFGQKPPQNRHWMYEGQRAEQMISEGSLRPNAKTGKPEYKLQASDQTDLDTNWTDLQESDSTWLQNGGKNTKFIKRILQMINDKNAIILDSFAGSGTTAQAVLELNQEDGGSRRFILVEMEDYANDLTAERVRRVIKGVPNAKNETLKTGLGGTFSYYELGKPIDIEQLFNKDSLPDYNNLAQYLFYIATGEDFDPQKVQHAMHYVGESRDYHIFLFYEPDWNQLMEMGLTFKDLEALPFADSEKTRLVYAPARYVDEDDLNDFKVKFLRLPYDIYRYQGRKDAN
jgi:adenine-specific DNA-methyltransferase